ncbi:hypothetical protein [Pseudobdellovibrio sp. HCB154]|uniref:hypothetical protein n=1 Tax=Pseudobdellovibrio sp. HCB154 TaxID=3386277 RepID=UPI0039172EFA
MNPIAKIAAAACLIVTTIAFAEGTTKPTTTPTTTGSEKYEGSATAAGFKEDMASFKQEMSMKLESAEAEIMALKEKAKMKGSKVKQTTIADLEKTKARIKTDLDNLDKSSESSWKNMKTKIATAMDNLNTKTQKALRE